MRGSTWLLIGVGVLLLAGGGTAVYVKARGLRNNNPGNIRHGASKWQGMAPEQTDAEFVQFVSPEYGIRAIAVTLNTYRDRYGINTIERIISRWAPSNENDTESYIKSVERKTGIARNAVLQKADYPAVIAAIITHENGLNPYTMATIESGVALA